MSGPRSTLALCLLAAVAAAAAALGWVRLDAARDDAAAVSRDLADGRAFLADPARRAVAAGLGLGAGAGPSNGGAGSGGPATGDPSAATEAALTVRIGQALAAAGVTDQRSGVTPGQPVRIPDTDFADMKVFLRFDAMTLHDLTRFLHHLAAADAGSRAQMIELGPADPTAAAKAAVPAKAGEGATADERWAADVTVAYLIRAPREATDVRR